MTATLWFMGRPAAGKSTIAKAIEGKLEERGAQVANLDGDELRKNLHPELGFTKEDRMINNRRTAFIAKLLNRHGITVITAMITPFRDSQQRVGEIIEPHGDLVLIYVKCSLEECARRDPKGMYEQAKAGNIENFTGVNHPFQEPHNPDIIVDTEQYDVEESVSHVVRRLSELGIFDMPASGDYEHELSLEEEKQIKDHLRETGHID